MFGIIRASLSDPHINGTAVCDIIMVIYNYVSHPSTAMELVMYSNALEASLVNFVISASSIRLPMRTFKTQAWNRVNNLPPSRLERTQN